MKPKCKMIGENGNVFNLIGIMRKTLRQHGLLDELAAFDAELETLTQSGGKYDDVLRLFMKYADIE
jgi:hypothetical protein